ncbi:MAG: hypothetical protein VCB99_10850, partial [Myxococcota bacterium]
RSGSRAAWNSRVGSSSNSLARNVPGSGRLTNLRLGDLAMMIWQGSPVARSEEAWLATVWSCLGASLMIADSSPRFSALVPV